MRLLGVGLAMFCAILASASVYLATTREQPLWLIGFAVMIVAVGSNAYLSGYWAAQRT